MLRDSVACQKSCSEMPWARSPRLALRAGIADECDMVPLTPSHGHLLSSLPDGAGGEAFLPLVTCRPACKIDPV